MMTTTQTSTAPARRPALQQVVVVSKQAEIDDVLESVLDAGHYDIVCVESTERAYSHIKRVLPDLVIVCLDIDDTEAFQVLSMLKLDADTRHIPVVTCTVSADDRSDEDDLIEQPGDDFGDPPALGMN